MYNNNRVSSNNQAGFTLIEMLIYAIIFVIFVGGIVMSSFSLLSSSQRTNSQIEVADNARFLTQKMQRIIQGATVINSPTVGNSAATLSVNTADTSSNPFVIDLSNGVVRLKRGSGAPLALTNSFVTVTSLSFKNYSYSTITKNTIRIQANVISVEPNQPASTSIDVFISAQ
ncbi:MAG: prepilin-type N-terminal cleavage/methylation domain-containing protein [Patescibacteria group bacterium]